MRRILFAAVVLGLGICTYAQSTAPSRPYLSLAAASPPPSFSMVADTITSGPVNGYDGVVRIEKADSVVTASGNVVIVLNEIRMTADLAVWHWGSTQVELDGGRVHLELPIRPTSIQIRSHR